VSPLYQEMVRLQTLERLEDEKGGDLDAWFWWSRVHSS
jgi:hypothetical protein